MTPNISFDKVRNNLAVAEFSTHSDNLISANILSVCHEKSEAVIEFDKILDSNIINVHIYCEDTISEVTIKVIKQFSGLNKYLLKLPSTFKKTTKGISLSVYGEIIAKSCIPSLRIGVERKINLSLSIDYRCHTLNERSLLIYSYGEHELSNILDCIRNEKKISISLSEVASKIEPISAKALSRNIVKINFNERINLKQISKTKMENINQLHLSLLEKYNNKS